MGLFSLIAKHLQEMKAKEPHRLSMIQNDIYTLSNTVPNSKKRRGNLTEPSYFNMYMDKKKRVQQDPQMEPHSVNQWLQQQSVLEHKMRIKRDKLHEVNKIINLIKPDDT
jgi:hypothetical protein